MRDVFFIALLAGLVGCTPPDTASPRDASQAQAAGPSSVSAEVEPVATSAQAVRSQTNMPSNRGPPAPAAKLALDGEGLRIFAIATGASRVISFGISKADALNMLESVQGKSPSNQGENIDCGATNAVWQDGLTVWFARDKFVGWSLSSPASSLSTVGGLKVGSSRAELEGGASVARIARSSLGEEFSAGEVGGLLDSADASARVTHLWAGAVCIAR